MATIANKILLCRRLAPKCRHFGAYKSRISNANTVARNYECFRRCKIYNNDLNERFLSSDGSSGLPADEQNMTLSLSHNCVKQLQKLTADENDKDTFLRVLVEGGGCSGFQYIFKLDTKQEAEDRVFERDDVKVVVDETSLEILNGSTIDYQEELIRSAFIVVDNPKAEMGCSCGVSFSLKI